MFIQETHKSPRIQFGLNLGDEVASEFCNFVVDRLGGLNILVMRSLAKQIIGKY
jgi:hypothetical protein